jgi:hypothetical protein
MFPMLNTALKGRKLQDTKDNKNLVTTKLTAVASEVFDVST